MDWKRTRFQISKEYVNDKGVSLLGSPFSSFLKLSDGLEHEPSHLAFKLQSLGNMIVAKKYEIANLVHNDRMAAVVVMSEEERRQYEQIEQHIIDIRANFINLFGEALIDHLDKQKSPLIK